MSLYWSVNKNMEIIKNIKEVSDVYFNNDKWDTYDDKTVIEADDVL